MTESQKLVKNKKIESFFLELTNVCNFSCQFCADRVMKRKRGFMDKKLAFSILENLSAMNYNGNLLFHIMGEPTLHENFFEILDFNSKLKNPTPEIVTNGSTLNKEHIEKLIKHSVKFVSLSVQIVNQKQFDLYHPKTHLTGNDYLLFIDRWLEIVIKNHSVSVPIEINLLVTRYIQPNQVNVINNYKDAKDAGLYYYNKVKSIIREKNNSVKMNPFKIFLKEISFNKTASVTEKIKIRFRTAHEFSGGATANPHVPTLKGFCHLPFYQMGVFWDGKVTLCCADYNGNLIVGDLNNNSIENIWNSNEAEKIRNSFLQKKVMNPFCQYCLGKPKNKFFSIKFVTGILKHYLDKLLRL